jgi:hypothetical protein
MKIVGWLGASLSLVGCALLFLFLLLDGYHYAVAGILAGVGIFLSLMYALEKMEGSL